MTKKQRIEKLEKEVQNLKEIIINLNKKINSIPVIPNPIPNPYYPQPYDTTRPPWVAPVADPAYWWNNQPQITCSYTIGE